MPPTSLLAPRLLDAILVLVVVEGVALTVARRRGRWAPSVPQTWTFLAAGAGLLVAVRAAVAGWHPWIALAGLALAGVAHAAHVALDAHTAGVESGGRRQRRATGSRRR